MIKDKEQKAKTIEEHALAILQEKKDIYFFCDLAVELGYSREWLNQLGVDKLDSIKTALLENKKRIKRGLRNKWFNNDNATTQIALYRLLSDEEELRRLNGSKIELTGANGGAISVRQDVDIDKLKELKKIIDE